jgi:hypothetical protein
MVPDPQALPLPDITQFTDALAAVDPYFVPDTPARRALGLVSFHDFAFYEYLLPPATGFQPPADGASQQALSDHGEQYLDGLANAGMPLAQLLERRVDLLDFEAALRRAMYDGFIYLERIGPEISIDAGISLLQLFYGQAGVGWGTAANTWHLNEVLVRCRVFGLSRQEFMDFVYTAALAEFLDPARNNFGGDANLGHMGFNPNTFLENFEKSIKAGGYTPASIFSRYPFDVFPPLSVNVGLRLVYRQEWTPLGAQRGEIVRAVPLGPGQKERVTTKIVRRRKVTTSTETTVATETTTESTDSTKDSDEIVREAAEANKWNVDAKASASYFGFVSVDVSGGLSGSTENKSKETSSRLSETMKKTASKLRRETKVIVSTESEESSEHEYYSEIANTNNEVAVTYEFHKLQHQYQVFTYLAEVESVIMVAEAVPHPTEINASWVRRNDWILARVLKDESHRGALNELIQDIDEEDPLDEAAPLHGGDDKDPFHDMLGTAKDSFAKFQQTAQNGPPPSGLSIPDIYAEPQRIYERQLRERVERKRANELRQIRRERLFGHIRDNILFYCHAVWSYEDADQRLMRYQREGRRVPSMWTAPAVAGVGRQGLERSIGPFTPTGDSVPLTEVVDPTGPIGYIGNYAVFGVRPSPDVTDKFALTPRLALGERTIQLTLDDVLAQMREAYIDPEDPLHETILDPSLSYYRKQAAAATPDQLKSLPDETVRELVSFLPDGDERIAKLVDANDNPIRDENKKLVYQITQTEWADYLYHKNASRRFLVDSNNLYLSIRPGDGASLEPFKRGHRYIDVLKAYEELEAAYLKNQRRVAFQERADEYDPDIAKVVIVGDRASTLAAAEAARTDGAAATASGDTSDADLHR